MNHHILPGKKAVKLAVILTPGTRLDHQIRRSLPLCPIGWQLPKDRAIFCKRWIAYEEFNEERLIFSCLCVLGREGMPPPVITVMAKRTAKHASISCNVMMVKQCSLPLHSQFFSAK